LHLPVHRLLAKMSFVFSYLYFTIFFVLLLYALCGIALSPKVVNNIINKGKDFFEKTRDKKNAIEDQEINKTSTENTSKSGKSAIDLSKGKEDRIKCQNDTWNGGDGWSGCYSESIDAMWRINHSDKVSADETHIIKNDMSNGSINGTKSYCYKASININNNSYTGTIYPGVDSKGNNYNAFRITGLSKDNANNIMHYELENGRAFCYRVYNSEALSQDDGHTILCTGRLPDGTYTYSNCATSQKQYQTNKPLSDQYNPKKYYERSDNIEIIVDATNRNIKKINEDE